MKELLPPWEIERRKRARRVRGERWEMWFYAVSCVLGIALLVTSIIGMLIA